LEARGEALELITREGSIVFEPRTVKVTIPFTKRFEREMRNQRNVYVMWRQELKPFKAPRIDVVGRGIIDSSYEVIATDLGFEKYLTIIPPSASLYNYSVVTSHELLVQLPIKRKVYYEEEGSAEVTVYIV